MLHFKLSNALNFHVSSYVSRAVQMSAVKTLTRSLKFFPANPNRVFLTKDQLSKIFSHQSFFCTHFIVEQVGYKLDVRLVDDFSYLQNRKKHHCTSFVEIANVVKRVALKLFFESDASVSSWSNDQKKFSMTFNKNSLAESAKPPKDYNSFCFSTLICGVIRGALETVNMKVSCSFVKRKLCDEDCNEIWVSLHEILVEQAGLFPSFAIFSAAWFCKMKSKIDLSGEYITTSGKNCVHQSFRSDIYVIGSIKREEMWHNNGDDILERATIF